MKLSLTQCGEFLSMLMRHEGAVLNEQGEHMAYRCPAGFLTIGYGHNLDANPVHGLGEGSVIGEEQARSILLADAARAEMAVQSAFPWVCGLSLPRLGALCDMAFCMGIGKVKAFSPMLCAMKEARFDDAAHFAIYRADRVTLHPYVRQVKGRAWETACQIRTGEWQKGFEAWMKF